MFLSLVLPILFFEYFFECIVAVGKTIGLDAIFNTAQHSINIVGFTVCPTE